MHPQLKNYILGILYRFQRNIFIIKELLIDLEKRG